MKIFSITIMIVMMFGLTACYQKHLVLQAEAVSMTKSHSGAHKQLDAGEEIEEKWCVGDELAKRQHEDDKVVGLADQVIYKAQGGGRRADFITQARVYTDTDGCAIIQGRLAKIPR